MAAYPTLLTTQDSTFDFDSGISTARATNGTLRARTFYPVDKLDAQLVHFISDDERATLDAFYAANRDLDVTYVHPRTGVSYTVRFAAAPQYTSMHPWWQARVSLRQV